MLIARTVYYLIVICCVGFVFRFEIGELSKYYFIDPEWLNKIFSSLVCPDKCKDFDAPGFSK